MPLDPLFRPIEDAFDVIPLGGAGGFGMNLTLYGHAGKWLMVDLGMGFADDWTPGVDILVPNPIFIEERRSDLVALVLTHAHEDHLGAVAHLWPRLRCPVYATPFTATVLRSKLIEHGLQNEVPIHEVPLAGSFSIGPFDLRFIDVTHSIPEPNVLTITTAAGTIVHTGDWKLDPGPVVGRLTDVAGLKSVGDAGVMAIVGDSTNSLTPGRSGSEADLQKSLIELFAHYTNRIAVACFSSNIARLESIAKAATLNGRQVAVVGRSLWRMIEAARATGYLKDVPEFLSGREASSMPRGKVVYVCTGSQGEPRSALFRIAHSDHPEVSLDQGDTVIFSARPIPGNEVSISAVQNRLLKRGVGLVTAKDAFVHVSGHPARDELIEMYQWIRPDVAIAVHGEFRHQAEHARIAAECQVKHTVVPQNGTVIRLRRGEAPEIVGEVESGVLAVDGKRLLPLDSGVMRGRRRMIEEGTAVVSVVMDRKGRMMAPPQVSAVGLLSTTDDKNALSMVASRVEADLEELPGPLLRDDAEVRETARLTARRALTELTGKKPAVEVHLVRIT